ncbi:MAG: DMT family transporter, partial [Firmicutes bacterium]|nr:DMT family transporter [Bacillota bacterium]
AIFPAVGSVLSWLFLKERISIQRWIFLCLTLMGVFGLSYSSQLDIHNLFMGILGVLMCSLGWGSEAVILAKSLQEEEVKDEYILPIRQASSALFYGLILLPGLKGYSLLSIVIIDLRVWGWIGLASFFASVSYLCYYRAISIIGAAKAMALNVSYSAWALIFSVLLFQNTELLNPVTILCTLVVLICGILAATDFETLL